MAARTPVQQPARVLTWALTAFALWTVGATAVAILTQLDATPADVTPAEGTDPEVTAAEPAAPSERPGDEGR